MRLKIVYMALVVQQGVNVTFNWNGQDWRYYEPIGWNANDPDSHLHVHWLGNGENTAPEVGNLRPGSLVASALGWDGRVHLNNGRIIKVAILFMISLRSTSQYNSVLDHVIQTIGIPWTEEYSWMRFHTSAISGGPERFFNFYHGTSPYRHLLIKKRLILSPTDLSLTRHPEYTMYNDNNDSFLWLWFSELDDNSGTHARFARAYWIATKGRKHRLTITYQKAHSPVIWNPAFDVSLVGSANAGTSKNSCWRWLCDPYDGLNPPIYAGSFNPIKI
jgi:hypothetical protein